MVAIAETTQLEPRDDSKYFVPEAHNNPLFDAYFFTHERDNAPNWPKVKYVLIVPEKVDGAVEWTLPDGLEDDLRGEMYVQFLNARPFQRVVSA